MLRAAAPLYEGKPVFVDHRDSRGGRSARDLAGTVRNVRFEGGRLRGDVAALGTEAGGTFLALAAGDAPGVGMSHVVLAERTADGREVVRIEEVLSVDAVAGPATVARLSESDAAGPADRRGPESVSPAPGDKPGDIVAVRAELAEARAELAALRAAAAGRAGADAAVEAAGLPDWAATAEFRRSLAAAPTDADRRALAEDRAALVERLRVLAPPAVRSRGRAALPGGPDRPAGRDAADFARALRGA